MALAGWLWQLDCVLLIRRARTRGLRIAALVAVVAVGLVLWALQGAVRACAGHPANALDAWAWRRRC